MGQCRVLERRSLEPHEELFGAIKQAGAMKILRQLVGDRGPTLGGEIGPVEEVLVHANRPLHFALTAKQAAHRLGLDFHHLDESLDRLVRLLVEQEVESLEIRQRKRPRFLEQLLDVDAGGEPAHAEKDRQGEQPPELDFH